MQVLIITDIFGVTDSLLDYARQLTTANTQVEILDPYQGKQQDFADEKAAYEHFTKECGFDRYTAQISAVLGESCREKVLVGFSAGAAATYKALNDFSSDSEQMKTIRHLIGFYPGQIRHHLDITPGCPVTLVFPRSEQHFDLDKVIDSLAKKANIRCIRAPFAHGFMNPLSASYHKRAAAHYYRQLNREYLKLPAGELFNQLLAEPLPRS